MKKYAILSGTAVLFAATLMPVFATTPSVGNSCVNTTTGPMSTNTCTIKNTSNVTVNNVNDAVVTNDVTAKANTGGNSASSNTLGGVIHTGSATLNTQVQTIANVNTTKISGGPSAGGNTSGNQITGPGSVNTTWTENTQDVNVLNSNTAEVNNEVDAKANTGYNDADMNTGPGVIDTGSAQVGLTVKNHVNDNLTEIEAGAGGRSNTAMNDTTGPFSENSVALFNRSHIAVNNVNDMVVGNDVYAKANTGKNDANKNTLGGDIETDLAKVNLGVETQGNINTTKVEAALGGFTNSGINSITGPGMPGSQDPSIWIENNQNIVVDNWNNKCKSHNASRLGGLLDDIFTTNPTVGCDPADIGVFNEVDAFTDTGKNDANTNTGEGSIVAGISDLLQSVKVHMNDVYTLIEQ